MALDAGSRLGSYEVLTLIGRGGIGEVYRARDVKLNRDIALKVLPDDFARDSARLARLHREVQLLAALGLQRDARPYHVTCGYGRPSGCEDSTTFWAQALALTIP